MPLVAQPLPWTPSPGREISDSEGNIVQYTVSNIGKICLAVNSHDKLVGVLNQVETWLRTPKAKRSSETEILVLVSGATGRLGFAALAATVEDAPGPSPELDRAISVELQVPEAAYTTSMDVAFTLIPQGWTFGMEPKEQLNPATGQPAAYTLVTLKSGDKSVVATSLTLPLAICAAALKTKEN